MGPYNTGDNGTEDGNTPRNYVDSSIPFGGSFDVPNRPRSRVASVESFSSTQDDWRHYLENSSADDPLPALYSAVSSQFLSRNTEMTPSSLMDELKRHSKRDGLLHRQSMPSSALLSESPALPSELTRSNASSVPVRQLSVRESCTKSPVLQLNGQFQESDQSARVGPLGGVPTFPLIPAIQVMPSKSVDSLSQNGLSNAPPRSPAPQRVISALADPVMIDPVTAAALNSQNWADEAEEETSESDEEQVEADRASTTGTVQSGEGRVLIGSPNLNGLIHLPELIPSSGLSESASARHPKKGKTPAYAWKKFSANIRKMGLLEHPSCSYLDRRPGGHGLRRQSLLQKLLLQQADRHGKYVQWTPNMGLAFSSCAEPEVVDATRILSSVLTLRDNFIFSFPDPDSPCVTPAPITPLGEGSTEPLFDPYRVDPLPPCSAEYRMEDGVYTVYWSPDGSTPDSNAPVHNGQPLLNHNNRIPTATKFLAGLKEVMSAVQHPACKTFTFRRLEYLRNRFELHVMFNASAELQETKNNKHRDFYNVRKVDTHVHHSACMQQKHLLRFIRRKFRTEPEEVVARTSGGDPVTLREIFYNDVGMTAWDASVDLLNVHALGSCFHRFDIFNTKYNPFGQALLREVFLKSDNLIGGRYLAELTKEVIGDLEEAKYQFVEWRVSIYGKSRDEWEKMANWVKEFGLDSKNVRWMAQIPRLYHVYRKLNLISSFGEMLSNIFEPLFDAVKDPESHPEVFYLLLQMNGWDSVDDESVVSKYTSEGGALPLPDAWTEPTNPPYSYWAYYMYANIRSLNHLLAARGMRTLPFRPHCGEAGSISHLASMYLLADGINHGIMLRKSPVLQYLYYLQQIGLAVSPLSNNALFHQISKNPFHQFFSVGLNLSLSTDDPLMFHFTDEPLLEEYSCCAHVWKLSPVDLCEIARSSVLQSHFEPQFKRHWLGENYGLGGRKGNSISHSNVSNIRAQYREDALLDELKFILDVLQLQEILDELLT